MTQNFSLLKVLEETTGLSDVSLKLIELHVVEQSDVTLAIRTPGIFFLIKNHNFLLPYKNRLLQLKEMINPNILVVGLVKLTDENEIHTPTLTRDHVHTQDLQMRFNMT